MSEEREITVVIAEDNEITRLGLELTLKQFPRLKVLAVVADGLSAYETACQLKPDIVLMDVGLPVLDGIAATQRIKSDCAATRVIMVSSHDSDHDLFAALSAGADGYCLKEVSSNQLEMAISSVADGAAWLDPAVAGRVLAVCTRGGRQAFSLDDRTKSKSSLSQREVDVLRLVVEGSSNNEIADKLELSVETIKTHMRHIMEKLSVADRTQAAVKAMRQGLV